MKIPDDRLEAICQSFLNGDVNPLSNRRELMKLVKEALESRVQLRLAADALKPYAKQPGRIARLLRLGKRRERAYIALARIQGKETL